MIEHVFLQISYQNKMVRNVHLLRGHTLAVGRTVGDIIFENDLEMSNAHFRFEVGDLECRVTDLGSTNSTWLNNAKVESVAVSDGDELRAGKTVFKIQIQRSTSIPITPPINSETIDDFPPQQDSADDGRITDVEPPNQESDDESEENPWDDFVTEEPLNDPPLPPSDAEQANDFAEMKPTQEQQTFSTISKRKTNLSIPVKIQFLLPGDEHEFYSRNTEDSLSFVIGRDQASDCQIDDSEVSSKHCLVELVDKSFIIRDLNSTNGTSLNGQEINDAPLADGDKIRVGETLLVVKLTYESQEPTT